jgi:hypothetical protein
LTESFVQPGVAGDSVDTAIEMKILARDFFRIASPRNPRYIALRANETAEMVRQQARSQAQLEK